MTKLKLSRNFSLIVLFSFTLPMFTIGQPKKTFSIPGVILKLDQQLIKDSTVNKRTKVIYSFQYLKILTGNCHTITLAYLADAKDKNNRLDFKKDSCYFFIVQNFSPCKSNLGLTGCKGTMYYPSKNSTYNKPYQSILRIVRSVYLDRDVWNLLIKENCAFKKENNQKNL